MGLASEMETVAGVLKDWLGEGGVPVPREIAQSRADVCLKCPFNSKIKLWEIIKSSAAEVVRKHIEVKSGMSVHVNGEDGLGMCRICNCVLPLKVHVPLKHILNNTDDETMKSFNEKTPWCFILTEQVKIK